MDRRSSPVQRLIALFAALALCVVVAPEAWADKKPKLPKVEGYVSAVNTTTGVIEILQGLVKINASTAILKGPEDLPITLADIAVGDEIEAKVTGPVDAVTGLLTATEVEDEGPPIGGEIKGPLTAMTLTTVTVLGYTIYYDASTKIEGVLTVGKEVQVELLPVDMTGDTLPDLYATKIKAKK